MTDASKTIAVKYALVLLLLSYGVAFAKTEILRSPYGPVTWVPTKSIASSPRADAIIQGLPTVGQLDKMDAEADKAIPFIAKYVPDSKRADNYPGNLDLALAGWLRSTDPNREPKEEVIHILGTAIGRYCNNTLKSNWAIVSTEFGMDIALVKEAPENRHSSATFAWSFVFWEIRNSIEDKRTDIASDICEGFKKSIEEHEDASP
jgi:hypothetical protein